MAILQVDARRRPIAIALGISLALSTLLRTVLYVERIGRGGALSDLPIVFVAGFIDDLCYAGWAFVPFLLWLTLLPDRWLRARWHRGLVLALMASWASLAIFLTFVEYFFFDEFNARFNTVAVDYLIYPHEVFVNIWESYPVASIGTACLVAGVLVSFAFRDRLAWPPSIVAPRRVGTVAAYLGGLVLLTGVVANDDVASVDRVRRELANNGEVSFLLAAYTRNLDYTAYYRTRDRAEAYARVRRLVATPGARFVAGGESIEREIPGDPNRPRRNVVIFLEESLGSEFFGSLGRDKPTCTPELDELAAKEGMLFTNLKASGNRTVRGMEGVLSSFPPLPGDSIVRRSLSDRVETIATALKRDGYRTLFLYGGRGIFDGMRSFTVRNGYDRFVEQKDFPSTAFTTIWGVSDEDLFHRGLEEMRRLHATEQPFLATFLTVSNHKPYKFPAGRIPEPPDAKRREQAVRYADWALGDFFRRVRGEPYWKDTIFVVVADHGARVYGRQTIPVGSYEIPLLILGPAAVSGPSRVATLGSSLDVAPTILGRIGRPYRSVFFGRDLLAVDPDDAWAVVNHNRDIGMMRGRDLAVLGLMHTIEFDRVDAATRQLVVNDAPDADDETLAADAESIFQVADELYTQQRYYVGAGPSEPPASVAARLP